MMSGEEIMDVRQWNWGVVGVILAGVVILIAFYQIVESSEAELRAEMHRIEARQQADYAELKADLAALSSTMDRFIERVDSRLNEVERNQSRLDAVNELLAQQVIER